MAFKEHLFRKICTASLLMPALWVLPALAAPDDPFTGASRSFDKAAPAVTDLNVGDWGVAEQLGAATYTFPIVVPPGRQGMEPKLALRYSSQSPLRGGVAAGWTLNIPTIEVDLSLGAGEGIHYKASFGSTSGRLVEVDEKSSFINFVTSTAYRLQFDESQTRFYKIRPDVDAPLYWVALTPDGVKHYFEHVNNNEGVLFPWYVTSQVDSFGNTVLYNWETVKAPGDEGQSGNERQPIDVRLSNIEYTSNENAGLAAHAQVQFEYEVFERCSWSPIPIGAAQRPGTSLVQGAQRLSSIRTLVKDDSGTGWRVGQVTRLTYRSANSTLTTYEEPVFTADLDDDDGSTGNSIRDILAGLEEVAVDELRVAATDDPRPGDDCKQNKLRYLSQIDVMAFTPNAPDAYTLLPPITFTYNNRINTTAPVNFDPLLLAGPLDAMEVNVETFGEFGDRAGARGSLLDVDGDGIRDLIAVIEENERCIFRWRRGLLEGTFDAEAHTSPLPTFDWLYQTERQQEINDIFSNNINDITSKQPFEQCTLGGQVVLRKVPGALVNGRPTWTNELRTYGYTFMDYTGGGSLDFLIALPGTAGEASATLVNDYPEDLFYPTGVTVGDEDAPAKYIWILYKNALEPPLSPGFRDSVFSMQGSQIAAPVALPTFGNREVVTDQRYPINALPPALFDINGDGFHDAIRLGQRFSGEFDCDGVAAVSGRWRWCVYLGNGGTTFERAKIWYIPEDGVVDGFRVTTFNENLNMWHQEQWIDAGLYDVTGDGLSDLVVIDSNSGEIAAYQNTGSRFEGIVPESPPMKLNFPEGNIENLETNHWGGDDEISPHGERWYRRRLVDLDQDGLVDLLFFVNEDEVQAAFNAGGYFLEPVTLPNAWSWAKRLFTAEDGNWHLQTDFTDVTGDGLADLAEWDGTSLTYISRPGLSHAPDLLGSVQNGRGLRIDFSYKPSSDPTVVSRTASETSEYVKPNVSWVVSETRVNGGFNTPTMTTRFTYIDPVSINSEEFFGLAEPSHFAGFGQVIRTVVGEDDAPARRVTTSYDYNLAPEGREVAQWTHEAQDNTFRLDTYRETQWARTELFAGQAYFVHRASSLLRTCLPNSSDADCMAQTQNVFRSQEVWTGYAPSTWDVVTPEGGISVPDEQVFCEDPCDSLPVELFVRTEHIEGEGLQAAVDDRKTVSKYDIRYGQEGMAADDYRVRVRETVRTKGTEMSRHSLIQFNDTTGLPESARVWRSAATDDYMQTNTDYDGTTGNLLRTRKPMQRKADVWTKFTYDDHKLFITSVKNELSQTVYRTHDLATGALVRRQGPNFKNGTGEGSTPSFEEESWQIDGFGRVLEHSVTLDDNQELYKLHPIERFTYNDLEYQPSQENQGEPKPVTIQHEARLNFDDGPWITSETSLDGIGRVQSETQLLENGAVAKTTYGYDSLGTVSSVKVPDPSSSDLTNPDAQVTYAYAYDGLGRLTSFSGPNGNGMQVIHEGLLRTVQESNADGSGGPKQEVRDVFGRLVEVREIYPGIRETDPDVVATTTYTYDANDNLERITDAAGSVTGLTHDWTDNRTSVIRGNGGRTWRYEYDLNGNMIREISPMPPEAAPEPYATTYLYDNLDRIVKTRYPADPADPDSAGETIKYVYDKGVNALGRLNRVDMPFGAVRYKYEARGLVRRETRAFSLNDPVPMNVTQRVERNYNAMGQLTRSTWNDGQRWQIVYDRRGMVDSVEWRNPQADAWQKVADYARNLAGLPVSRDSSYGQSRTHTYDVLGRPAGDTTTANGVTLATRSYTYSDSSDLLKVDGTTGDVSAAATYDYDAHHRLRTAAGPNGYRGAFSYSLAGNINAAEVYWTDSPHSRNVRYEYGEVDPQAVDRLVNTEDGEVYASFAYDLSGNMTRRAAPDGETLLHWNGLDQLRAVESPNGKESYFYDHNGSRMLAVNETGGIRFWFGERETRFDASGTQTQRYLHLSGDGPTLARIKSDSSGDQIELQYADALQNLMFSLDESGNTVANFLYGAFGEAVYDQGADDHRRQFNGKEHDVVSGLRYYGYRYYDPLTLRWSSSDSLYRFRPDISLSTPRRMNLYSFSLNNPVRYFDPDGADAIDMIGKTAEKIAEKLGDLVTAVVGIGVANAPGPGDITHARPSAARQNLDTILAISGGWAGAGLEVAVGGIEGALEGVGFSEKTSEVIGTFLKLTKGGVSAKKALAEQVKNDDAAGAVINVVETLVGNIVDVADLAEVANQNEPQDEEESENDIKDDDEPVAGVCEEEEPRTCNDGEAEPPEEEQAQ